MKNEVIIIGGVVLVMMVGLVCVFGKYLPDKNLKAQSAKAGHSTPDDVYYAVIFQPIESQKLTSEVIAKHAQHLRELDTDGKLILAGFFTDDPSSLLILRGKNKEEIKSIMEQDPLIFGGFKNFEVRTWLMSNRENNYMPKPK